MASSSRETIHVSLGSTANAVSAHLSNLQGLAATSPEGSYDANVTHAEQNGMRVPRYLFVQENGLPGPGSRRVTLPETETRVPTWNGSVEILSNEVEENSGDFQQELGAIQQSAERLAHSSHSRYRSKKTSDQFFSNSNGRHVQWDEEEEEEEEDYEDEEDKRRRLERQEFQWQTQTKQPLEEQMEDFWTRQQQSEKSELHWSDYWMPPYMKDALVTLPYMKDSINNVETWDSYLNGMSSSEALLERLRHILEDCDAVQGITIATEGYGIYAGLTTSLLQEMQDECRTAGRMVWQIVASSDSSEDKPWQVVQTERVRRNIQQGLALHSATSNSHAVLPLSLPNGQQDGLFSSSAQMALALEAATLPYRLSGSDSQRSKIGLIHGFYGGSGVANEGYGTTSKLSFGEYLACLQSSSEQCVLELDACFSTETPVENSLLIGTSVERQRRMQNGEREVERSREILPGGWLAQTEGLLRSFSPSDDSARSAHHHFSLTSYARPDTGMLTTSQYVTCLMEGMVIRYRPETSVAAVMNESVASLTSGGYGAGSYWKSLGLTPPVLSVLGNSTRSYSYLHSVASDMKQTLRTAKFRGYHNRDTASGVLPEAEDCEEALQHCFQIRDAYSPPDGSGLVVDEEGTYFDDSY